MTSISDIVLGNIESISESYAQSVTEPGRIIQELSTKLHSDDSKAIHKFERIQPITDKSLIAVDGGNAMEQLTGGDLIVAGATIGEGLQSKPLFETVEEYPSEAFFDFFPHSSNNDKIQKAIRAALELRILELVPSDYKIIDGAYMGNISTVLFALLDNDPNVSNAILKLNNFDEDGLMMRCIDSLLRPSEKNNINVIAVVKNDSSKVFAKQFLKGISTNEVALTDRILASRILNPGEFLAPRNIDSNPALIAALENRKRSGHNFGDKSLNKAKLHTLLTKRAGQLRALRSPEEDRAELGILWTTYFKPTAWSQYAKAIKIEFPFRNSMTSEDLITYTRKVVQIIDQDIVEEGILEPWSQYTADVGAKGVSHAINMVKSHLLATSDEDDALRGLVRGYRT